MLDTISSNEFPLFGTMSSSSCGMEGIVIQRPLATESYSWSDLSIVLQDDSSTSSYSQDMMTRKPQSCSHQYGSCSSLDHHTISDDVSVSMQLSASMSESTFSSTSSSTSKKSVRFAPSPSVRTYSVVLGDHPLCDDGLAIELGWEYCDDSDQATHIDNNQRKGACQKRSYLSRKQLLLDVAGCTKEELDQRSQELQAKKALMERNRSYREDYYYCLAFAKRWLRRCKPLSSYRILLLLPHYTAAATTTSTNTTTILFLDHEEDTPQHHCKFHSFTN